ncbi:5-methyltetrahydropteroyltriglutamate--homocysteine methyltransferase [archaeon HR06]|nr:5-methyltetrahydropteroyltriglutamate--homocysteine methyltransferase [archaeon HR06]
MKLIKTVIGSFPPKKGLKLEEAIKEIIDLQLKYNIDIVSDGEQRYDIIGYFYQLKGIAKKRYGLGIESRIEPLEDVKEFVKVKDFEFVKNYLKSIGREDVKIKVTITGPITLGFSLALNGLGNYSSIRDLRIYEDTAEALKPILNFFLKKECYLQIDEPSLSTRVIDPKEAAKFVNLALEDYHERLIIHVCGSLSREILNSLTNIKVKTISLAFSGPMEKSNINLIEKDLFKEKKLGFGCVSVLAMKEEEVEEIEVIENRIRKIVEKLSLENISFIHPDCGLRSNSERVAEKILKNMSLACKNLEN